CDRDWHDGVHHADPGCRVGTERGSLCGPGAGVALCPGVLRGIREPIRTVACCRSGYAHLLGVRTRPPAANPGREGHKLQFRHAPDQISRGIAGYGSGGGYSDIAAGTDDGSHASAKQAYWRVAECGELDWFG